ncbi:MAG TPA: DNA polymerase III subunit delta' [Bacillota bacterium]
MFSDIIGHKDVIQALKGAFREGKVGHAYLFIGPAGVGKKTLARKVAAELLCNGHTARTETNSACECPSCRSFRLASHPDFITVSPAGNSIKIEQLRLLQRNAYLKPLLSNCKVFFFPDAEQLTEAAANSFLKLLEEPPRGVYFLFTAVRGDCILPTIRSRCQVYNLFPVAATEIGPWLEQRGVPQEEAGQRALACHGLPAMALAAEDSSTEATQTKFSAILKKDLLELLSLANELEKEERQSVLERVGEWANQSRLELLRLRSDRAAFSSGELHTRIFVLEKLVKAFEMLEGNANQRLVLEELFLACKIASNRC